MKLMLTFLALVQLVCLSLGQFDPNCKCNRCDRKLELGIILDSSSSISRDDFSKAQRFLQDYLKKFDIGPDIVRVSIITYGQTIHPEDAFNLTTYSNTEDVVQAIGAIPHHATTYTATGEAIRFMRERQLASQYVRPGVRKVGVVFTDGNSQETQITADEGRQAREQGIVMFAIGISQSVDNLELLNIAGDNARVDRVDSYDKLVTITDWLARQTCI